MIAEAGKYAVALGLVLAASGVSAGTTFADIQGTKMAVFEPSQMPEFVRIELRSGYEALPQAELLRRVQLAVEGLTGCTFAESLMAVDGRVLEVGFDGSCWFHGYYDSGETQEVQAARNRIFAN